MGINPPILARGKLRRLRKQAQEVLGQEARQKFRALGLQIDAFRRATWGRGPLPKESEAG